MACRAGQQRPMFATPHAGRCGKRLKKRLWKNSGHMIIEIQLPAGKHRR
jgi:hypothetical protein